MFKEVSVYKNRFVREPSTLFSSTTAHVKIESDRITVHHDNINKFYKRENLPVPNKEGGLDGIGFGVHLCWLYGSQYRTTAIVITDYTLKLVKHIDLSAKVKEIGALEYVDHIGHEIVLSNDMRSHTLLVNLITGDITEFKFRTDAVILDESQTAILGFAEINYKKKALMVRTGKKEIMIKIEHLAHSNEVETVVLGDKLVFGIYNNIATGSELACYDLKTNEVVWQAEVKQLNADHSKYRNDVLLSAFETTVIMEGQEAYGSYLQLFDLNTGKRIFDYFPPKK